MLELQHNRRSQRSLRGLRELERQGRRLYSLQTLSLCGPPVRRLLGATPMPRQTRSRSLRVGRLRDPLTSMNRPFCIGLMQDNASYLAFSLACPHQEKRYSGRWSRLCLHFGTRTVVSRLQRRLPIRNHTNSGFSESAKCKIILIGITISLR